jgi:pullulanase
MIAIERDYDAYLDELKIITILVPHSFHKDGHSFKLIGEKDISLTIIEKFHLDKFVKYICKIDEEIELGRQYWIFDEYQRKTDLQIGAVTRTIEFDQKYYYNGRLGVHYQSEISTFKLWAPTATAVKLKLIPINGDEQDLEIIEMIRGEKGVWSYSVERDVESYRYMYLVCVNLQWKEALDPYAVATTANGKEGVVVDLKRTDRERIPLPPFENPVDAIIYETHVRDFTIHPNSGVNQKGTYLGLTEDETKDKDGSLTGLAYVKNLGITHLELLPLHDFEGVDELGNKEDYNWGYNPLHFNVPEGSYSTNPIDPYSRIRELKYLIDKLHENKIRVIIDVVYNHVYIREESSFEKVIPGYFFRHDEHGMPSNGTGVGNDIATERLMVRKFILDSVLFWLQEYHVDGFRFDLMGILDVETMNAIREEINKIDPSILIIGEGWELNTPLPSDKKANIRNQAKMPGIAHFNDWFRDTVKGSTFNLYDAGFALGNPHYYEDTKQVIAGSIGITNEAEGIFKEPSQTVNYVESHDNHTLWDKILACRSQEELDIKQKFHRLATVMVLLSQGIPFLHSGQEFYRTKKGIGNSYRSPNDINQLDWDRKNEFKDTVDYIKGIIDIRKQHQAFRLPSAELIRKHLRLLPLKRPLVGWILEDVSTFGPWSHITIILNPTKSDEEITLPEGNWSVLANGSLSGIVPLEMITKKTITLKSLSPYVLVRN